MNIKFQGKNLDNVPNPFIWAGKTDGAMLCIAIWLEPGKVQQAETMSVYEFGQYMGGN
jgi:hypothetical protein